MSDPLHALYDEIRAFTVEKYPGDAQRLVFGDGQSDHPRLMLIGEAPGGDEVTQQRPFVGKAGKNLDEFLLLAGLDRSGIYVTNAVKFRPTLPGKNGGLKNRTPKTAEIEDYKPFLEREAAIVCPSLLVTLGNTPLHSVMGNTVSIGDVHGRMITSPTGRPVFCLYHPASVIYRPELKEVYRQDVITLGKMLQNDN